MNMKESLALGQIQTLQVVKTTEFGVYLATPENQNSKVLLPKKQVPEGSNLGSEIEVFIYKDSEDRLIATTTMPPLSLGEIALLTVKEVSKIGAFLDWGLAKDLLLPFKEQTGKVNTGDQVLVTLYIDKSERLCASMKVYEYLSTDSPYKKEDKVSGLVYEISDQFGAFVAVDNQYSALISSKELVQPVKVGQQIEARVVAVKEDGKLDLSLREKAYLQMDEDKELILKKLQAQGGFLPYHDKSNPEDIKREFELSKNAFKRAVGRLLKEGSILLSEDGIHINKS